VDIFAMINQRCRHGIILYHDCVTFDARNALGIISFLLFIKC